MQLSRDTKRFLFSLSVFTVALVLCVINFSDVGNWLGRLLENFSPFIIGGCIAFILSVPMSLFNKLLSKKNKKGKTLMKPGKRKLVSLLLSILFVFLVIGIFSGLVVPQIISTISALADSLMSFVSSAQLFISNALTWLEEYPEIHDAVAPVIPDLDKMASTLINVVQRSVLTLASTLPGGKDFFPLWKRKERHHLVCVRCLCSFADRIAFEAVQKARLCLFAQALL